MVEVSEGVITGSVEAQAQWGSALRWKSASNRLVNCLGNDPLVEGGGGAEFEFNRVLKTTAQREDFIYQISRKLLYFVKPHSEVFWFCRQSKG